MLQRAPGRSHPAASVSDTVCRWNAAELSVQRCCLELCGLRSELCLCSGEFCWCRRRTWFQVTSLGKETSACFAEGCLLRWCMYLYLYTHTHTLHCENRTLNTVSFLFLTSSKINTFEERLVDLTDKSCILRSFWFS